jgi:uncharacterized protein YkwD/Mg-chelatase subunit ChlD
MRSRFRLASITGALVTALLLAGWVWQVVLGATPTQSGPVAVNLAPLTFDQAVIELTNAERVAQGLLPLKNEPLLAQAALAHSQAMSTQNFFDHKNPVTGTSPDQRVSATGYAFITTGENIALGQTTPEEVMESWMNSPGHRANILDPDYREIGLGYVAGAGGNVCGLVTCEHYWTQEFGAREDIYPLVINNDSLAINTPTVRLDVFGDGWAKEMRLRNDNDAFGNWQPFQSNPAWELLPGDGTHSVTAELRNGTTVLSATDSILLDSGLQPTTTTQATSASSTPAAIGLKVGDVFAAVDDGKVQWYSPEGTLKQILDTKVEDLTTGMAFDGSGNLYVTNFYGGTLSKFDSSGKLLGTFGSSYSGHPESIVFDQAGNVYVGAADGDNDIRKFNNAGQPLAQFDVAIDDRGSDWIELAADQCTLFYTSEGSLVKRFDVCTNSQLPDFASGLDRTFALRLLPEGGLLVANSVDIQRLDANGKSVQIYDAPGEDYWFALNRDPDSKSFWSGNLRTGNFYKFDIATGQIILGPITACRGFECLGGLTVFGELVEAAPPVTSPTPVPTPTPASIPPGTQTLKLEREVAPKDLAATRDQATITLTFTGDNFACVASTVSLPVDVVLVIDQSGSMGDPVSASDTQPKLDSAKAAAKTFVDHMNFPDDHVAIVAFSGTVNPVLGLESVSATIKTAIDSLDYASDTNIAGGLQGGLDALANARPDASQVIVLLSDGQSDLASARAVADEAEARGIKVVSIGFGADAAADVLQAIASTPADYYFAPDAATLQTIYPTIAQSIRKPPAATEVVLQHQFDASHFSLIPDSIAPAPMSLAGDTITWKVDQVGSDPVQLTYRVQARYPGAYDEITEDAVNYFACGDPAATSTLSAAATGRITISPPPVPAPVAQSYFSCAEWWWSVVSCLLPLLLLLLLGLWYFFLRSQGRDLVQEYRKLGLPCLLTRLALLLWTLFFLFLIGREIANTLCRPKEVVYFWRMSGDSSGIATVPADRPAQPIAFAAVNNVGCVGCHAVSPQNGRIAAVHLSDQARLIVKTLAGEDVSVGALNTSFLAWSHDGNKLAYTRDGHDIYLVDFLANANQPLTGASDATAFESMPTWSADDQTIAFARVAQPTDSDFAQIVDPVDIYTVPAAGGTAQPLSGASGNGFSYYPAYSPDGQWLAFTHHLTGTSTYADPAAEIYLVPAGGGEAVRLEANDGPLGTPLNGVSNSWPTWSADGKLLAFNSKRNDPNFDIFVTEINSFGHSSEAHPLAGAAEPGVFEHLPQWGPPIPGIPLWQRLLALWPWLLPFIPLLFLIWWLCRPTRFALTGKVTDAKTGDALSGGVSLISLATTTLDAHGRYQFADLKNGDYEMSAASPGYQTEARTVTVKGNTVADFQLARLRLPARPPEILAPWQPPVIWEPDPTIIIGVGGAGRHILTHLKKNLRDAGAGKVSKRVQLLLVDTDEFERVEGKAVPVSFAGVALDENDEVIPLRQNLNPLIQSLRENPQAEADIARWFPAAEYAGQNVDLQEGTQQRRPPARLGLFEELKRGEASRLWQALLRYTGQAIDQDRVRVILVGSTAGGLGSSLTADLAFLARRAGLRHAQNVIVEAYLVLDSAFAGRSGSDWTPTMGINTFASVRELGRLQMLQGYEYPWPYRSDLAANSVFNGTVAEQLFDQWYLFDADRDRQTLAQTRPTQGVFPTIADAITLWLDKASRASHDLREHQKSMLGVAISEQFDRGSPIVGGLGSFTYRLPIYDIVETVKVRWALNLLGLLLSGDLKSAGGLDPALNREFSATGLEALTGQFLAGTAGYPACPSVTRLVGEAVGGQMDVIEKALPGTSISSPNDERHAFAVYLANALSAILTGQEGVATIIGRGGKIGFAVRFLELVVEQLSRAESHLSSWAAHVDEALRKPAGQLAALPAVYRAETEAVRADLLAQAAVLSTTLRSEATPAQPAWRETEIVVAEAAFESLRKREANCKLWREEMNAIQVRKYIWAAPDLKEKNREEDLAERWYRTYLAAQLEEHLSRFYWRSKPEGGVELVLRAWEDLPVGRGPEAGQKLMEHLLRLAEYAGREIWNQETLASVLAATDLRPERLNTWQSPTTGESGPGTAHILWNGSGALLPHDIGRADKSRLRAVLGVNRTVAAEKQLAEVIQGSGQLVSPTHLYRLSITDPYSLLLVQLLEIVPLSALYPDRPERQDSVGALARAARQYFADVLGWIGRSHPPKAYTPHGLAAERNALKYERRLAAELNVAPTPLHPLIVTALEDELRTRHYALGLATGFITISRSGDVELTVPGHAPILLVDTQKGSGVGSQLDPAVRGLLTFVAGAAEWDKALNSILNTPEAIAALAHYKAARPDLKRYPRPEARDLAALVWLVVNES